MYQLSLKLQVIAAIQMGKNSDENVDIKSLLKSKSS